MDTGASSGGNSDVNTGDSSDGNTGADQNGNAGDSAGAESGQPENSLEGRITVSAVKSQTYTGKAIKPAVTVKDAGTGKTLKLNKQYTLTYENNVDAGTAAIVIEGVSGSGYEGSMQVKYQILPRSLSSVSAKTVRSGLLHSLLCGSSAQVVVTHQHLN